MKGKGMNGIKIHDVNTHRINTFKILITSNKSVTASVMLWTIQLSRFNS